jgi:PP-loop superfamily ATP-utilizing enzyme
MAKRKTPKTEKVIDLTPKAEKITDEQLKKVQETVNNLNRSQIEIGQLESRKHEMLHGVAGLRDNLAKLQTEFQKDYGTFDVNIENGTINYPKENGEADKKD